MGGLEVLRAFFEEFALGIDDGANDSCDGALALLDRFDQPARVADVVHQELARLLVALLFLDKLAPAPGDVEVGGRVVGHLDFVLIRVFVVINDRVGGDGRRVFAAD